MLPCRSLLQVNCMRIEEPGPGESVVESTGQRIFFTTTARDFSRSCKVGVSQAAALALSGLDTMSEFQQAHEARAISFPPLCWQLPQSAAHPPCGSAGGRWRA